MHRTVFHARTKVTLGAILVVTFIVVALLAPLLAPADPDAQNLLSRLQPPAWRAGGDLAHLLGTDAYGRDLLSRLIFGARISMTIGISAMLLSCALGTLLGMVAAYRGGVAGVVVMRLADAQLAVPAILLAILVVATMGGSLLNLVLVLGISSWMVYARVVFGMTRALKERPFVEAAAVQGASDSYILAHHILPHLMPVVVVISTLQVAQLILTETALSFLGLGVPPPAPSWGNILAEGQGRLLVAPWIADAAGISIVIVVWGINMLGNGLREYLDPQRVSRG